MWYNPRSKRWLPVLWAAFAVSSPGAGARAQGSDGAGAALLDARASLEILHQRHDNLFLRPERASDGIFSWRPGAALSARRGARTRFDGEFTADVQRFSRREELDATHRRTTLSAETGMGNFFLRLNADDRITRDRTFTTLTELLRRRDRAFSAAGGSSRDGRELSLSVDHFSRDYESRLDLLDHDVWTAAPFLRLQRGSWAWNAAFSWTRYGYADASPRDGDGAAFRTGLEFVPGGPLSVWGGAGLKRRAFDGPSLSRFFGGVADAGARWAPGPRLQLSGGLAADAAESVVEPSSGYYREHRADVSALYRAGAKLSIEARHRAARQAYGDASIHADFRGRRRDRVFTTSFRGTYRILENTAFWAETAWENRGSNRSSQEYRSAVHTAGLRIDINP